MRGYPYNPIACAYYYSTSIYNGKPKIKLVFDDGTVKSFIKDLDKSFNVVKKLMTSKIATAGIYDLSIVTYDIKYIGKCRRICYFINH